MTRFLLYWLSMVAACVVIVGLSLGAVGLGSVVERLTGSSVAAVIAAFLLCSLVGAAWTWGMFHTRTGDRFARWLSTLTAGRS